MKLLLVFSLAILSCLARAETNVQVGTDFWSATNPPIRYLPNYNTPQDWNSVGYFGKISSNYSYEFLDIGLKVRSSTIEGAYIDQASIGINADGYGIRAGILPFRITWCETYNFNSVWMREPDSFCSYRGLSDGANSAPGVQWYASQILGSWAIDEQAGVYRESIYNQSKSEGAIFFMTGIDTFDRRSGLSINAMHLPTATQFRFSILDVSQNISGEYQSNYRYRTVFAGAEFNPIDTVTIKATALGYFGRQVLVESAQSNYQAISYSLSIVYQATPRDQFGMAIGQSVNQVIYPGYGIVQKLRVPTLSLAYRRNIDEHFFVSIEYQNTSYVYTITDFMNASGQGEAIGMRLGITY